MSVGMSVLRSVRAGYVAMRGLKSRFAARAARCETLECVLDDVYLPLSSEQNPSLLLSCHVDIKTYVFT